MGLFFFIFFFFFIFLLFFVGGGGGGGGLVSDGERALKGEVETYIHFYIKKPIFQGGGDL